jgi:gas vesicle protein
MTRGNNILLAAFGGAAVGALVATYLTTEKGRQMLESASTAVKDLSAKARDYAKENFGEVIRETKDSLGGIVKEKIAEQVQRQT